MFPDFASRSARIDWGPSPCSSVVVPNEPHKLLVGWMSFDYYYRMDPKRDELETRIATLELKLVSERARPTPNPSHIERLERQLSESRRMLERHNQDPGT